MATETRYEIIKGKVTKSYNSPQGTSFKIELTSEKPIEFLNDAYAEIKNDRFLPNILTNEKVNEISIHSKFAIPTNLVDGEREYEIDAETVGEGSVVRVKLKGTGKGIYPVAIIVTELVEKEPYNPFDF